MRIALVSIVTVCVACSRPAARVPVADARTNDQRTPAGRLADGVHRVELAIGPARWFAEADSGPAVPVTAFREIGSAPTVPGPLIRVVVGTRLRISVRNESPDTTALVGLGGPGRRGVDTLRIPPGATDSIESTADTPGTYGYAGLRVRGGELSRPPGNQLFGALIVDSAGAPPDRVFVIDLWQGKPLGGADTAEVMTLNGKSWPFTERIDTRVGDTLRFRLINGTLAEHPMHLHGFYYRVDSRGGWSVDTIFAPDQRRLAVTETIGALGTLALTWVPDRPGNWLFHCHVAFHIAGQQHEDIRGVPRSDEPTHSGPGHLERDMAGLVIGIRVAGDSAALAASVSPSAIGAVVRHRIEIVRQGGRFADSTPKLGYRVDGKSGAATGEPLVLTRGTRAAIAVINQLAVPSAVHWHGIELESYYDGVAGWSGAGTRLAPMIVPGDSFVAIMTPPRAGTFIYHAHVDDQRQLSSGLVGPLLVLEPGATRDPARDQIWLFSQAGTSDSAPIILNGGRPMAPIRSGIQRIRVININSSDELDLEVSSERGPSEWRAIAKDGADLPPTQVTVRPARVHMGPGETWDFLWNPKPGRYRIAVKSYNEFTASLTVR